MLQIKFRSIRIGFLFLPELDHISLPVRDEEILSPSPETEARPYAILRLILSLKFKISQENHCKSI